MVTGPEELIATSGKLNGFALMGMVAPPTMRLVTVNALGGVAGTEGEKGGDMITCPPALKASKLMLAAGVKVSKRITPRAAAVDAPEPPSALIPPPPLRKSPLIFNAGAINRTAPPLPPPPQGVDPLQNVLPPFPP